MIHYSKSFVDFLSNSGCKVARLLYKAHCKPESAYRLFVTNKQIDYITFRNDGTVSYLPAGKPHKENEETGDWAREGRQNGKPGKVIQKLFTANALKVIHGKEFECFTNEYKAEYNDENFKFTLRQNKSIPSVYDMRRAMGGGTLNDSCMNGDSEDLDIYKVCGKLKILTLTDADDKLCGRALVWKISDELTIMDRIYVVKDFIYDMFLNYARTKSWYHKRHYRSYDYKTTFVAPDGTEKDLKLSIDTDTDHDSYPYIDTFSYGDDGSLNNYGSGCYTYDNTDGARSGGEDDHEGEVYDDVNDRYIDEDDAVYITAGERRYTDRHCHRDNCVSVGHDWYHEDDDNIVEVNGDWYKKTSDDISEIDGDWYMADEVVYSEYDSSDYLEEDCIYSDHLEDWILKSDSVVIDGKIYHKDDVPETEDTA